MHSPHQQQVEDAEREARLKIEIVESPRPEDGKEPPLPTYHELLDYLCRELGVPGSPTFWDAVAQVKRRLAASGQL